MLMGEGKTTVVCPLLGFILAKSSSLVVQVVPHALGIFSRALSAEGILGRHSTVGCYARIQPIHVSRRRGDFRARFARRKENRAIVIASPTSIKSLSEKFLEGVTSSISRTSPCATAKPEACSPEEQSWSGACSREQRVAGERVADAGGLTVEEMDHLRAKGHRDGPEIFQTAYAHSGRSRFDPPPAQIRAQLADGSTYSTRFQSIRIRRWFQMEVALLHPRRHLRRDVRVFHGF